MSYIQVTHCARCNRTALVPEGEPYAFVPSTLCDDDEKIPIFIKLMNGDLVALEVPPNETRIGLRQRTISSLPGISTMFIHFSRPNLDEDEKDTEILFPDNGGRPFQPEEVVLCIIDEFQPEFEDDAATRGFCWVLDDSRARVGPKVETSVALENLLKIHPNPNVRSSRHPLPLILASCSDQPVQTVNLLLDAGANPHLTSAWRRNPVFNVLTGLVSNKRCDYATVERVIQMAPELVRMNTLVGDAVRHNIDVSIVQLLIEKGAEIPSTPNFISDVLTNQGVDLLRFLLTHPGFTDFPTRDELYGRGFTSREQLDLIPDETFKEIADAKKARDR